jgi:ABC-type Fe3+/spermidine/putrescine transport system ATPase subunit
MPENVLSVDGLHAFIAKKAILEDISLQAMRGEIIAVLGASGCGKTTLLRVIAGFVKADRGTVSILGSLANRKPPEQRSVSMLFQEPALFDDLSVAENALLARRRDRSEQLIRVEELADKFRLTEHLNRKIRHLSGGEKQRAALIRTLVNAREIVLLDEPIKSAFNLDLRWNVMSAVKEYLQRESITTLVVTHDFEEAAYLASKMTVLVNRRACALQSPNTMYLSPPSQQVARLLGSVNELPAETFLDPLRRENECPVKVIGGELRQMDGSRVVMFRPSSLHILKHGTAFQIKEVLPLGESYRVRLRPCNDASSVLLEASVRQDEEVEVGSYVNLEIKRESVSVFNALGERLSD